MYYSKQFFIPSLFCCIVFAVHAGFTQENDSRAKNANPVESSNDTFENLVIPDIPSIPEVEIPAIKLQEPQLNSVPIPSQGTSKGMVTKVTSNIITDEEVRKLLVSEQKNRSELDKRIDKACDLIEEGDYQMALEILTKLAKENPKNFAVHYNKSVAHLGLHDLYESLDEISICLDLNEKFYLGYYQQGMIYEELEMFEKAVKSYELCISYAPTFLDAYINLGNLYYSLGSHEKAIEMYQKFIELEPKDSIGYYNLANVYRTLGNYSEAIRLYQKAIEIKPNYTYYNNLGIAYALIGKVDDAIKQFHNALELEKNYTYSLYNLGDTLRDRNRYKEAINFLQKAIDKDPHHPYAYTSLGICFQQMGDLDRAINYYELAIKMSPDSEWKKEAKVRLQLIQDHLMKLKR